jgi:hypothetical protein
MRKEIIKKILFIGLLAIVSCQEPQQLANVDKSNTKYILINNTPPLKIIIIDSCEYLHGIIGPTVILTHKGNCKHCKNK